MKKNTIAVSTILLVFGLILHLVFTGHDFIGFAFYLAALLTLIYSLCGKKVKRTVTIVLAVCLVCFCIVEIPIIGNASGDVGCDVDYIIVLGAAVHGDTPSLSLIERLEAARDYLLSHPRTIAVVSGGQGDGENVSEAESMYVWLCSQGIEPQRIVMETESESTLENLRNSFDIIKDLDGTPDGDTAVVSSEYHIYRAKLIARSLGTELLGIPAHTSYLSVRLNYFIREAFAVTYQWIFR